MKPKFIAFYLPQFHTIPENDLWWGEGFTEWVRVKNAEPLFPGHNQPRIPWSHYDLSDVNVMKHQAKLAMDYGIYGFCYYHYWFNGKLLLEKPLEQMLADKEVNIPFCLSWANESWTRAWDGDKHKILISQDYGDETDWLKHLEYLIPFLKDDRYIKLDGKPVFLIYSTSSFTGFDDMINYWNKILAHKGLPGLYIVETLNSFQRMPTCISSVAAVEFEPMYTVKNIPKYLLYIKRLKEIISNRPYRLFNYDEVWDKIIKRQNKFEGKEIFLGAFVDWDNSPRFRKDAAVFTSSTPEKFYKYLKEQVKKSKSDFIFINAWNEWAEGAYLEPDTTNEFRYLESVKRTFNSSLSDKSD